MPCPKGTMFLKSVDASSHVKDANLIFILLAEVVEKVGAKHVVQVIKDNAANYVAIGNCFVQNTLLFFGPLVLPTI